jgi:hypothetical protein
MPLGNFETKYTMPEFQNATWPNCLDCGRAVIAHPMETTLLGDSIRTYIANGVQCSGCIDWSMDKLHRYARNLNELRARQEP